jgi:hypothetical protein
VFGPTSAENLTYATINRNMWVKQGEAIVAEMVARVEQEYNEEMGLGHHSRTVIEYTDE